MYTSTTCSDLRIRYATPPLPKQCGMREPKELVRIRLLQVFALYSYTYGNLTECNDIVRLDEREREKERRERQRDRDRERGREREREGERERERERKILPLCCSCS